MTTPEGMEQAGSRAETPCRARAGNLKADLELLTAELAALRSFLRGQLRTAWEAAASIVPAFLRSAVLERVAEGWPADRIAAWLGEKYGLQVTGSDVLSTLKQANAERSAVAQAIIRDHMRAELPEMLTELGELRKRAERYETEAHAARDWTAVRGFMAEQRNGIGLALRYSGAADPEEPSAEARAEIERELSKALDALHPWLCLPKEAGQVRSARRFRGLLLTGVGD